ncbi:NAD(P)/FAD-dependent oxidoreductase [Sphingomonas sp. BN140010]|uniref:NAD(P)/FAD-dependent oxidoreductase n=1 Tax=Sphingomonas arvum TaxID=2992113 RepID=A0ABT3JBW3_9SPHN|nr:NAD(P)/FAD-dependent oxidoreductase [Sphingomonas sp. BN140010]MCW3796558.1 NAD(P)/FAD-dependent oxidoreductase [Sphingomonas sp. BN140010]
MSDIDVAVIGGGVVGLACAVALARRGLQVMVLERAERTGSETSSRNSEVIHAGIYYPPGSLKARLCVDGRDRLYAYCAERSVPHRRVGKLIFAASEAETAELDVIAARADSAGAGSLDRLDAAQARRIEPELGVAAALFSPRTGIIDSHAYMLALEGELNDLGGAVVCHTRLTRAERVDGRWQLWIAGEDEPVLGARLLVNAAGLHATQTAALIDGLPPALVPGPVYARGCYFSYGRPVPFTHLIYPVPVKGGLGTHLTLDLAGRARFGPNVEWIDDVDYTIAPHLHAEFLEAARKIWPAIEPDALHADYAGVRPKVRTADGAIATDFIVQAPDDHGLAGLVNLFGIESPGLTASLALGDEVAARLERCGDLQPA